MWRHGLCRAREEEGLWDDDALFGKRHYFYAFSAIEMKVIVVGPGLDIVQFSGARKVI